MKISFFKMQGTGNDMIMIDNLAGEISLSEAQIRYLCDRNFGIGADGLILVESVSGVDCFMNYYNSDGTSGEMCGNGIRCTAKYFLELSGEKPEVMKIGTRAGVKTVNIVAGEDFGVSGELYSVNMGRPMFESADFPMEGLMLGGYGLNFVSMGNPHAVAFVEDVEEVNLEEIGPRIEHDRNFPNRINFEVVQKLSANILKMRVWERGSGITLACGTGACAVYAIALKLGKIEGRAMVQLPGGNLLIEENENGEILMTGPAENVFTGEISI